jgi:glycerate kinase
MKILLAPSGYKESLDAIGVVRAMELGVRDVIPDAEIVSLPLVDGGEGFTDALVDATCGALHPVTVTGPVGQPVLASVGMLGGPGPRTAVIELAAAAGLRLVPRGSRNPLLTTSRGVGELISAALDLQPQRIIVGCGDSGVNDGGVGLASALGVRFLDAHGQPVGPGGAELARLAEIDTTDLDPRLARVDMVAACNPFNVLCGEFGVARVFGPQKGATPTQVEMLAEAMDNYAAVIHRDRGVDVALLPGSGASGGVGTALMVFCSAALTPRFEVVERFFDLDASLAGVDLVLTGEGSLDHQTPNGKIPAEVAGRAAARGIPTVAIAGTVGAGADANLAAGLDGWISAMHRPMELATAIEECAELVREATTQVLRLVAVGERLATR